MQRLINWQGIGVLVVMCALSLAVGALVGIGLIKGLTYIEESLNHATK